jgi:hypothetical protein
MRLLAVVAALVLAGCLTTPGGSPDDHPSTTPAAHASVTSPTGAASAFGPEVVVNGTLSHLGGRWWANLTAHNVGTHTFGWFAPYCVSPRGWTAHLAGPGGDDLAYRHGDHTMGCSGISGAMEPGTWLNWTFAGGDAPCDTATLCDNVWDGTIRDCRPCDDEPYPAPAGTYTWTFTFTYHDEPGEPLGDGGYGLPRSPSSQANLTFELAVP